MIEVQALRKANAQTIRKAFEDLVVFRYGTPEVLLTDNGTEFANRVIRELATALGIHISLTPPYHAQANPVERVNRVLKSMITCFVGIDHREWDEHLVEFRHAYNSAYHSSLGMSPAFLNYGHQPRASLFLRKLSDDDLVVPETKRWASRMQRMAELYDMVVDNLGKAFSRQSRYYNTHHRSVIFQVGDRVRRKVRQLSNAAKGVAAKLFRKYSTETYTISNAISPLVYEISNDKGVVVGRHHVKDLISVPG